MKTFIEVQEFGDFGMKYTNCIMVSNDNIDKETLLDEFYKLEGIESYRGLDYLILDEITEKFINFLKSKGFKRLKTQSVFFCD
jgi:hypothetical protein